MSTIGIITALASSGELSGPGLPAAPTDLASLVTWIDPSDLSSLDQTTTPGTTAVTADGDPVKSITANGRTFTAVGGSDAVEYNTDGTLHWLRADGSNNMFDADAAIDISGSAGLTVIAAFDRITTPNDFSRLFGARGLGGVGTTEGWMIVGNSNALGDQAVEVWIDKGNGSYVRAVATTTDLPSGAMVVAFTYVASTGTLTIKSPVPGDWTLSSAGSLAGVTINSATPRLFGAPGTTAREVDALLYDFQVYDVALDDIKLNAMIDFAKARAGIV